MDHTTSGQNEPGQILFTNSASAGNASITSYGSMQFLNNSTAGSADIENGGDILFSIGATAGSAKFINFSLGEMEFSDSSTAGNATIDGYDTSSLNSSNTSSAGSASIESIGEYCLLRVFPRWHGADYAFRATGYWTGILDISGHNAPGVTIGSIESGVITAHVPGVL